MTAEQYIETLPDVKLIFAYIECIIHGALTGAEFEDFDIFMFHKEYEDVKDEIDTLVEQARDRALTDYRIASEGDILRYYDETYGEFIENNEDLQEYGKKWKENPWKEFRDSLNEVKAYYKNGKWYEHNDYYFIVW